MTPTVAYLDASAAVKLIVAEAESAALARALGSIASWVSSEVLDIELRCVARRAATHETVRHAEALLDKCDLIGFSREIRRAAGGPWEPPQRALDAIHLACVATLDRDGLALISYDRDQLAAAQAVGIACMTPT